MARLEDINRAVEMTAQCNRVEYNRQASVDSRWVAELWCNAIGELIHACGHDAWTAVQAVHALCHMHENRNR